MEKLRNLFKVIKLGSGEVEIDVKSIRGLSQEGPPHLTVGIVTSDLRNNQTVVATQLHLIRWGIF